LSLNPDGSEDSEIKIKGLPDIKVGDFTREEEDPEDGTGGLLPQDVEAIEKAKARAVKALEKRVQKAAKKTTKGLFISPQISLKILILTQPNLNVHLPQPLIFRPTLTTSLINFQIILMTDSRMKKQR